MSLGSIRLTRVQREAYESVRRITAAPLDSITLRHEITTRTAQAIPSDMSAMATCDPDVGVFSHGMTWDYPESVLEQYYAHIYPEEGAIGFLALAKSGAIASREVGPLEAEQMREHGIAEKLHVAFSEQGRLWGGWCLGRAHGTLPFSDEEVTLARMLGPLIAQGLRRAALIEVAESADPERSDDDGAPGVAVYDAHGHLVLRDARASRYTGDLDDVGHRSDRPVPIASALWQLHWRLRGGPAPCQETADAAVRMRGRSGRWYAVRASATECSAASHAGQAVVVITPLGGGERASMLARLYGLTPREREVVSRLARGESGKEIAAALGLSAHTVQAHIDNASARIGVRGRRELVAKLFVDATAERLAS
jgi:DNA-binding CsgD family transcriptional regulator